MHTCVLCGLLPGICMPAGMGDCCHVIDEFTSYKPGLRFACAINSNPDTTTHPATGTQNRNLRIDPTDPSFREHSARGTTLSHPWPPRKENSFRSDADPCSFTRIVPSPATLHRRPMNLRAWIDDHSPRIGTLLTVDNPAIVEVARLAGFDYLWIDAEHAQFNDTAAALACALCAG